MTLNEYLTIQDPSFDQLSEYIEELLYIDTTELGLESTKTSRIFKDLYKLLQVESKRLRDIIQVQEEVTMARRAYYGGKAPGHVYRAEPLNVTILKTEIESYLNIDAKVTEARGAVAEADLRVKMIEDSVRIGKQRVNEIRNALEWKRLTQS